MVLKSNEVGTYDLGTLVTQSIDSTATSTYLAIPL